MVLAVSLALSVVWTPHGPLADSLALSGVRRFGSNYTRHAHLGLDRVPGRQSRRRHHPVVDQPAGRAGHHERRALPSRSLAVLIAPRLGKPRRASPLSVEELQQAPKLLNRLLRAVRRRRRPHQRQPRLHVRLCLDLLEVDRPRRHADRLPVGVCRRLRRSAIFMVFNAVFGRYRRDHAAAGHAAWRRSCAGSPIRWSGRSDSA